MTPELQPGMIIKNYVLMERLGSGAAGEVWRAVQTGREVAIKFMNLGADSDKLRKSMQVEVKALQKLHHLHIPALYDYDLSGERPFLVMQPVAGMTYDRLIASGELLRVPVKKRLDALEAIASAVVAAHEHDIIHRDIKPGNVCGIEVPYLLDFGIAIDVWHSGGAQPQIGTAIYMPPDNPPDRLSDHYSFAVMAYEVLFGRHPIFTPETIGKNVMETRQIAENKLRSGDWRWPSRVPQPELPADLYGANLAALDAIFVQAFGPRDQRFTDLARFVRDLRASVTNPENLPYVNRPAPPQILAAPIPTEAAFTSNEVAIERQATDHGMQAVAEKHQRNWLIFASTLGLLVWFVVIAILILIFRGG
jgi:serine/threonine protein kinase